MRVSNFMRNVKHAYFIGIGGVGMSSLARILKHQGVKVSGSDLKETKNTKKLSAEGITIHLGQNAVQFDDADLVVYSTAIASGHIELQAARQRGIRLMHRAEMLSSFLNEAETSIAITGTHGKTTTSSMVSFILSELGRQPTCLVGGDMTNLASNAVAGNNRLWVAEVDESDKSHLLYKPNYAIITNLEMDHVDHYQGMQDLENCFRKFLGNLHNPGLLIYSLEDALLAKLASEISIPKVSFGLTSAADFSAENIQLTAFQSSFDLIEAGFFAKRIELGLPGIHNIRNALAAIALLVHIGLDLDAISEPLKRFRGANRRLEVKFQNEELTVIDDYAHHPTELRACVESLKRMGKKIKVVFQPHRFSRTTYFCKDFAEALRNADQVVLTEVYGAGEEKADYDGSEKIQDYLRDLGHEHTCVIEKKDLIEYLSGRTESGDVIAFVGAGDIGEIANEFAGKLKSFITAEG